MLLLPSLIKELNKTKETQKLLINIANDIKDLPQTPDKCVKVNDVIDVIQKHSPTTFPI